MWSSRRRRWWRCWRRWESTRTPKQSRAEALSDSDRRYWSRALPPTVVGRADTETTFWAHVRHGDPAHVWVRLEDGTVRTGLRQADNFTPPFDLDGRLVGEATFVLPADLPLGYHRVHLSSGGQETSTPLIITPAWLGLPARLGARRAWGLATQLYSVRSENSWGIGDLADLTDLAVWAGACHGAGYVLVNPLHAAAPTKPMEPSPYLPTSRRYTNPLYLRVEAIDEFAYLPKRSRVWKLRADIQGRARKLDGIDRDAAWAAKRAALKMVYRVPRSAGRQLAFDAYKAREGTGAEQLRRLVRAGREVRRQLARVAGRSAAPGQPRGGRLRRTALQRSRFPPVAAVAARRPARRGAVPGAAHRHAAGHHARPRRRRAPRRRRRLGTAGRAGARGHRGRTAGRVQPAGPELVAAAVAARPTGRAWLPTVSGAHRGDPAPRRRGAHRPHHRVVPVVVDSPGCTADRRAPTSATTTTR